MVVVSTEFWASGKLWKKRRNLSRPLAKNRDPIFQKDALLLLGKSFLKRIFRTLRQTFSKFSAILQEHRRHSISYTDLWTASTIYKALEVMESLQELNPTPSPKNSIWSADFSSTITASASMKSSPLKWILRNPSPSWVYDFWVAFYVSSEEAWSISINPSANVSAMYCGDWEMKISIWIYCK